MTGRLRSLKQNINRALWYLDLMISNDLLSQIKNMHCRVQTGGAYCGEDWFLYGKNHNNAPTNMKKFLLYYAWCIGFGEMALIFPVI